MVWTAHDAWRSHPSLVPRGLFQCLPGLSKALIAFGAFVVVDKAYSALNAKDEGHGHGHDENHGVDAHAHDQNHGDNNH